MNRRILSLVFAVTMGIILAGCGTGSGGSSATTGALSMSITDAKPVLPATGVESVSVTFDEISVHKSGGGWTTLAAVHQPYTIDLYQFSDGNKTQFVPPVQLESGKYTQVRIGVVSGTIRINGVDYPLEIPSENLRTEKNFEFNVQGGGGVDLTVDFDLSQSVVLTGSGTYQLKPVLHLVTTTEAWTIQGKINSSSFGSSTEQKEAIVIVFWDSNRNGQFDSGVDEEYTRLRIPKGNSPQTEFRIFWLVPEENYNVQVFMGDPAQLENLGKYEEFIETSDWSSKTLDLNGGAVLF